MVSQISLLIIGSLAQMGGYPALANATFTVDDQNKPRVSQKAVPTETVTITAEAESVEIAKTPSQVVVIGTEKIARSGAADLTRLLELAFPGRAVPSGGPGTQTSLFINGARSKDTVVLLDGIRVTDPNLGLNMSNYCLAGVDRVEILMGPASTLYGSDTHSGVVSMSSGTLGREGFSGHVLGLAGSNGQIRLGAMASYGWDSGWAQGSGDAGQSPQAIKTDNPYRQSSGYVGAGQQFGENWLIKVNHRSSYIGTPTPFTTTGWPPVRCFSGEREDLMWQSLTTASLKGFFSDSLSCEVNLGSVGQENLNNANTPDVNSPRLDRNQGNAKAAWKSGWGGVVLLADFINENLRTNFYNAETYGNDENVTSTAKHTAFALEGSIEPLSILRFVGSVRQQRDMLNPYNNAANSINQMTWKAGANLLLPSGLRAYISSGTSFNSPSLSELNTNIRLGLPIPENEKSRSILAGVGYEYNNRWWLRADVSRISYSELIDWGLTPSWDWYVYNISNVRVQGLEVAGGVRGKNWDTELWARSQEGRQLSLPEEEQLMAAFQRRPFFSAGLRGNWIVGAANFGVNLSYIGHRYDYPIDASTGPSANKTHYIDCSLLAAMQFGKSLAATLRAERLFQDGLSREDWVQAKDRGRNNVGYSEGFPSPGRSLSLEFRFRF
ncbi:MAG: TonB-dependent receptor [Holophagales bacterium]|jgi:vitamin B12 transporter|nr:TonB-dependent receptor [Holophagales bacterium]